MRTGTSEFELSRLPFQRRGLRATEVKVARSLHCAVETCIAWLAGHAYEGEEDRRIDLLRAGHDELVTAWATEDANRILRQ